MPSSNSWSVAEGLPGIELVSGSGHVQTSWQYEHRRGEGCCSGEVSVPVVSDGGSGMGYEDAAAMADDPLAA